MKKSPQFTLVLGAGAAKGLAHIGVLDALNFMGLTPTAIVGCSIGSLIGAVFSAGVPLDRIKKIALRITKKKIAQFFKPKPSFYGLTNGSRVIRFLSPFINNLSAESLPIHFASVVVDLITGQEYVLRKGPLLKIVRASISIPGVFTPVFWNDKLLIDGGVSDPVPVEAAKYLNCPPVIAVNVLKSRYTPLQELTFKFESPQKIDYKDINLLYIAIHSLMIMESTIIKDKIARFPPDVLIEPDVSQIKVYEFYKARQAISKGFEATIRKKEEILKILSSC